MPKKKEEIEKTSNDNQNVMKKLGLRKKICCVVNKKTGLKFDINNEKELLEVLKNPNIKVKSGQVPAKIRRKLLNWKKGLEKTNEELVGRDLKEKDVDRFFKEAFEVEK